MKRRKRIIILGIAAAAAAAGIYFMLNGSGANPNASQAMLSEGTDDTNILVVYFSRANEIEITDNTDAVSSASLNPQDGEIVGNTEIIAREIAAAAGADIYPIITKRAYPANYTGTLLKAGVEMMLRSRPSLAGNPGSLDQYDVVFLGFPNWDGTLPMAAAGFLEENDFSGKTIVPFVTHKGSGFGSSMGMIEDLVSDADVYTGGWSCAGDSAYAEETRRDAAAWAESVLSELGHQEDLPIYEYMQQEIEVYNDGQKIYGIACIPDTGEEKVPLAVCAHGLGGSYRSNIAYAEQLAMHGIAAYCFDFRGGGGSRSDGDTTEMSVMTEVSDLEAILSAVSSWDFVDGDRIVLLGTSQGGITSAIAAARHTDEVSGLILMYPAFLIGDAVHEEFDSLEEVPDSFPFQWILAGRPYVEDMWDYDVYEEIGNYTDKVLLMHGDADDIVPIAYSERAAETYADVEYYVIDGAGHGFNGGYFDEAVRHIFDYLQKTGVIHTA